ncbi:MAG: DUF192 domain-containing protein [Minisyncoccia bacterium]
MFQSKIMIILAIVLIILLIVGIYFVLKKERSEVWFKNQNLKVEVEVAETLWEQARGLMGRQSLAEDEGMLFVFSDEAPRRFWMKNTFIPLDLIFISAEKKIVEIKPSFEPCVEDPCPIYQSQLPAKYVLEVNGGFCERHNIRVGDELELSF